MDWFLSPWFAISGLLLWGGVILSIAVLPPILLSRKLPQAKMAWILAAVGFPWIGPLFYVTFGRRHARLRYLRIKEKRTDRRSPARRLLHRLRIGRSTAAEMVGEIEKAGAFPIVAGNAFTLLTEGEAAFAAGRHAMREATHHIHLITYIFRSDATGKGTIDLLAEAAARGVAVRVLYDGAGTFATRGRFFDPVRAAGGKALPFLPLSPWVPGFRLNLRNHRKLLVVDGEIALTGGMNIGDEYYHGGEWRDVHASVRGPVVTNLQRVFAQDWEFATGEAISEERYFAPQPERGDVAVQVVPSGPDQDQPLAPELMFGAIAAAKETVDIMTPYLIPTEAIEQALRSSARRGRRVRIIVPDFVEKIVVRWAADSYLVRLIEAGVEIWRHPHMVHGKLVIIDKSWVTLGSTNLDMRSLWLNFELNIAIPSASAAQEAAAYFEGELAASKRLTAHDLAAPVPVRMARAVANLASPLL